VLDLIGALPREDIFHLPEREMIASAICGGVLLPYVG